MPKPQVVKRITVLDEIRDANNRVPARSAIDHLDKNFTFQERRDMMAAFSEVYHAHNRDMRKRIFPAPADIDAPVYSMFCDYLKRNHPHLAARMPSIVTLRWLYIATMTCQPTSNSKYPGWNRGWEDYQSDPSMSHYIPMNWRRQR